MDWSALDDLTFLEKLEVYHYLLMLKFRRGLGSMMNFEVLGIIEDCLERCKGVFAQAA